VESALFFENARRLRAAGALLRVTLNDVKTFDRGDAVFGNTALTVPRLPLSRPRRSTTVSPLTIFGFFTASGMLEHLRRERGYLQEAAVAQFATDRFETAYRADRGCLSRL
jgi:hypothetical protein